MHRLDVIRRERQPAAIRDFIADNNLLAKPNVQSSLRTAVILGGYGAMSYYVYNTHNIALYAVTWCVLAVVFAGFYSAMHEATHYNMFSSAGANRVAAVFWATALLVPAGLYAPFHMHHHAYTRQENRTGITNVLFKSKATYLLPGIVFNGTLSFGLPMAFSALLTLFGRHPFFVTGTHARRFATWSSWLWLVTLVPVAAGLAWNASLMLFWLAPMTLYYIFVHGWFTNPEHYGLDADRNLFEMTRTMDIGPITRFLYWNNNFHAEHHLAPAVPYSNLPQLRNACETNEMIKHRTRLWEFHRRAFLGSGRI